MNRMLIIFGGLIVVILASVFALAAYGVRRLNDEDRIPHMYFPVVNAIWDYCDTNQIAPERLEHLVPAFIESLPSNRPSDVVSYSRMDDGTNWMLHIEADVKTRKVRWIYMYSPDPEAHPPDNTNRIGGIHTWQIFKASMTK